MTRKAKRTAKVEQNKILRMKTEQGNNMRHAKFNMLAAVLPSSQFDKKSEKNEFYWCLAINLNFVVYQS